ncbi:Helix-destabilizing protein [Actinomyces bovis]|uniref:Helix-destabilizing protein n=1 Tax=Actinomyces bovis TaxID=1658 RepID=A0ABY1VP73_9ACTO|nr:Helix-destabilizing protein [Actinomyces bovis]VEG53130.1 Helix-destabilizing protein [Actinomyces israelii]
MRVIVQGRLTQRSYQTREGASRTVYELLVDEVGPSLRYAKAEVTRTPRASAPGGQGHSGGQVGGFQGSGTPTPAQGEPQPVPAAPATAPGQGYGWAPEEAAWGGPFPDEPPF